MNYEELFNNSLTNVPKTFPELFCNTEILLEMYNRKVVNVNVEDGIYANVYQFESIQEFLNERNLKLNDLRCDITDIQIENLKNIVPNIKSIFAWSIES